MNDFNSAPSLIFSTSISTANSAPRALNKFSVFVHERYIYTGSQLSLAAFISTHPHRRTVGKRNSRILIFVPRSSIISPRSPAIIPHFQYFSPTPCTRNATTAASARDNFTRYSIEDGKSVREANSLTHFSRYRILTSGERSSLPIGWLPFQV